MWVRPVGKSHFVRVITPEVVAARNSATICQLGNVSLDIYARNVNRKRRAPSKDITLLNGAAGIKKRNRTK